MSDIPYRLLAPRGTDECNIGTNRYTIHDDGFFYIPRSENIEGLLKVGGFTMAPGQASAVTISADRLALLEHEESALLAAQPIQRPPTVARLVIPG